jgi:hypothetical protein
MDGHIHHVEHHKPVLTEAQLKKNKRNWLRIAGAFFLDMLPIILGILIATGINEWRDNSHRRHLEIVSLKQIRNTIESQRKVLENEMNSFIELQSARSLIFSAIGKSVISHDSLYPAINNFLVDIQPDIKNIGFFMLQNTGKLDIISNKDILDRLINLYQFTGPELEKMVGLYTSYKRTYLVPHMNKNYSVAIKSNKNDHTMQIYRLINGLEYENIMRQIPLRQIVAKYEMIIQEHSELAKRIAAYLTAVE